jgi:hypothetical protein
MAERTHLSAEQTYEQLLGAWKLVSWEEIGGDGAIDFPLGSGAVGLLIYDRSGHVSAQLARSPQTNFESEDWRQASSAEMTAAWPSYFGYFGTFSIDAEERTVTHHIEAAWFPNLVGSDQIRHFRIEPPGLVLDAETAWGRVRIVWKRP